MMNIEVTGTTKTILALDRLETKIIRKSLTVATRAAARPIEREAARLAPEDEGRLNKTLATNVSTDRNRGTVDGRVGQGTRKRKRYKAMPIHLTDQDTAPHGIPNAFGKEGSNIFHPGTQGQEYLKRAFVRRKSEAEAKYAEKLDQEIGKIAAQEGPKI